MSVYYKFIEYAQVGVVIRIYLLKCIMRFFKCVIMHNNFMRNQFLWVRIMRVHILKMHIRACLLFTCPPVRQFPCVAQMLAKKKRSCRILNPSLGIGQKRRVQLCPEDDLDNGPNLSTIEKPVSRSASRSSLCQSVWRHSLFHKTGCIYIFHFRTRSVYLLYLHFIRS